MLGLNCNSSKTEKGRILLGSMSFVTSPQQKKNANTLLAFFFCLSEEMGGIESRSGCEASRPNREAGSQKFPSVGEEIISDQFLIEH